MAAVGSVSVKVVPDLSEFEPALREHVRRIVREEIAAALGVVSGRITYMEEDGTDG